MNNVTVNESDVLVSVVPDEITVTISDAVGIPPGGTANQVLKKNSATDYDVSWASDVAGVPYTGATQDVNLGEFGLLTGNIEFDTSPTNAPTGAGSMVWNDTEGTADLMLKGGSVNLPIGQKQVIRAVNGTGGNLTRAAYRAVKITGAQGQRLQVNLARADNDANSKDTIGLVAEDISNNQTGFIVTSGTIENINTTGNLQGENWADGDTLYLSGTTSGVITNVKPSAPTHTVILGFVIYAHQNNGKIYVKVDNGYELDELHNVNVSTAASGDYLRYNGTLWVDSTIQAGDLPAGTVTGTATSGQVSFFNGASTITGDNSLFWDNSNKRLGILNAAPLAALHVGNRNATGSTDPLILASRTINSGSGNSRGFSDSTNYARSGGTSYASYDARIEMTGTNNFGHYAGFQAGPTLNFTGTITDVFNYISSPTYTAGTITNSYGTYVQNPVKTGATLTNNYGHYFPSVFNAGTNNWVWYNASTERSYSAGDTISRRFFAGSNSVASPSAQFHADGTGDIKLRLQQTGQNYWDFTSVSGTTYATIADVSGTYVTFFNLGNVALGTTTNNGYKLDVQGSLRNTTSAYFATSSGNVGIGTVTLGTSANRVIGIINGTAPTTSPTDVVQMYANDITAGNAALHVRTEGGAIIKLYQQTTGVAAATFVQGSTNAVYEDSTFGGYTLKQIVQALQNAGFLA